MRWKNLLSDPNFDIRDTLLAEVEAGTIDKDALILAFTKWFSADDIATMLDENEMWVES
jgi:hypothetical protein